MLLWVPREVTERRSKDRGDTDTTERLRAWDETLADLTANAGEGFFHLRLCTDRLDAEAAAKEIIAAFDALTRAADPRTAGRRQEDVPTPPDGMRSVRHQVPHWTDHAPLGRPSPGRP